MIKYMYIPGSELYKNPRAVERLRDLPNVINRFDQGYPDSVNGIWVEFQSPAHVLGHLLNLEMTAPAV